MRYGIIVNPMAGSREMGGIVDYIGNRLSGDKLSSRLFHTEFPGHARDIAEKICGTVDRIIIVGGDGTINEVVNGIVESGSRITVGIVPAGSGNDAVKGLNIPEDIRENIAAILGGHTREVDVGKCNERYFLNIMGVGFDAAVGAKMHQLRMKAKKKKGSSFYNRALLHSILHYRSVPLKVEVDDQCFTERYFLVSIANGTTFGGEYIIAPMADMSDGYLRAVCISDISKIKFFLNLGKVKRGVKIQLPEVRYVRCTQMKISSVREIPAQVDGEYYSAKIFDLSILPRRLKILVPEI